MDFFFSVTAARIIFVLGIINALSAILILMTCRCIPQIAGSVMQNTFYRRFYRYHCYIWWIFWTSVVLHLIFSLGRVGIPF